MTYVSRIAILICAGSTLAWGQSPDPPPTSNQASQSIQAVNPSLADARKLLQQGKYDDAIAQLLEIKTKNSELKGMAHELGSAYYAKGDFPKAADFLQQALQEDPNDSEATQLLGLSFYLSGRPSDAIPNLEKVQSWYPRANVNATYILGMCYMQTHD